MLLNTRKFSAAALFIAVIMTVIMPLMTVKASAGASSGAYDGVKTKNGGSYSAALLDADFYDSMNGCLTQPQESQLLDLMQPVDTPPLRNSIILQRANIIISNLQRP